MKDIFLVTGNANKLREWHRLLPPDFMLESADIDLPEIQSIDLEEIVADKAKRAYQALVKPVIVEDISAELVSMNGLPGPFIKFFIKAMGEDVLYQLTGEKGGDAIISCTIGYYDGNELLLATGKVPGKVVSQRGEGGFGFDKVFIPEGSTKTYSEMTPEEKDQVSHRSRAIAAFLVAHAAKVMR
jgi:inosine triphosphate pyrophosphatase